MQKKIMILGGNSVQQSVTLAAKELGHYVISVDYIPDNPAHKYADEYYNVSTLDKEAVLELAKRLGIDGILTYASDVSVTTVAYVANKLNLPTNPLKCMDILTHKNLFRHFLKDNGFPCPRGAAFTENHKTEAYNFFCDIACPCVVKPVDSSGSKGVFKVSDKNNFKKAFNESLKFSISKTVIVERFIDRIGGQTDGDGFVIDGKIKVFAVMDQHQDKLCNPYVPVAHSYPSTQPSDILEQAKGMAQKIFDLLGFKFGAFNYEYIVGKDSKIYILEIGPRNGGNMIADACKEACGIDMAKCSVQSALGLDCSEFAQPKFKKYAASYVLHSLSDGVFKGIKWSDNIKDKLKTLRLSVKPGDKIKAFRDASDSLGFAVLAFDSQEQMCEMISNMNEYVDIII